MRTTIFGLLICIFICTSGELNANELQNPGFEDGVYWSQELSPWTTTSTAIHWFWNTDHRKNGRWTLDVLSGDTLKQQVAVTPFTDYILTVPFAGYSNNGTHFHVHVSLYVDDEEILSLLTVLPGEFRYFSVPFNSEERETVTIGFRISGGVCNRVDDIMLVQADTVRPRIVSAMAYDGEVKLPGIDDDDYIVIVFSEPTNTPRIRSSNIDEVFHILSGHTWLSSSGNLWSTTWNKRGDTLRIDLYAVTSDPPTIEIGDQFHADLYTITDECGNPVYRGLVPITIGGTFYGGPVGPRVRAREFFHQVNDVNLYSDDAIVTEYYIYESPK